MASTVLVVPARPDQFLTGCIARARAAVAARGESAPWVITAERVPVAAGNGWGRHEELLKPEDAIGLYRKLHEERVLVLEFGHMWVRRDPRRDPPVSRAAIPLQRFVAHKASYGRVNKASDIAGHLAAHAAWCAAPSCRGDSDPRILPLHVFATTEASPALETDDERKAFADAYGSPSRRTDSEGRLWKRGPNHGGWSEIVTVAGTQLSRGLHWDVEFERGEGHLYTAHEVWKLSAGAYLNVGPSSDVRLAKRRSNAKKIWP